MQLVLLVVETDFALVLDQVTVAKASTMIPVLVWMNVQPLIPTLGPMMTLFVVSGDPPSISLNFTCSFVSEIDWPNANNPHTHPCKKNTECQISCGPGFAVNITDCSCKFIDGCEAAGQPCQNGGTCTSDLSVLGGPYYNCTCANGYSGLNCTSKYRVFLVLPFHCCIFDL